MWPHQQFKESYLKHRITNVLLDIDECSIGMDDCPDEGICSDTVWGAICTCKLGYRFKDEERQECIGILAKG